MDAITKVERASSKLIDLGLKIYCQMRVLSELEICGLLGSKTYKKELEVLQILIKKESALLEDTINNSGDEYGVIRVISENTYCYKNAEEYQLVAERLIKKARNIIRDNYYLDDFSYYDDEDEDEIFWEADDYEKNCEVFKDIWRLKYLLKLEEDSEKYERIKSRLITKKYELAFVCKDLFDELASVSFNVQALLMLKESISIKDMKFELDKEEDFFQEALFDIINCIGIDIAQNGNQVNRKDMFDMFNFFIHSLDNVGLIGIKETIRGNRDCEAFNKKQCDRILRIILRELSKRETLEKGDEPNEECEPVKEDVLNNLFSLIRLDAKILDLYDSILEGDNIDDDLSKLEAFLEFEDGLISKLVINNSNLEVIVKFLDNDLGFVIDADNDYDMERKKFLIRERIFSTFKDLEEEKCGESISELSSHIINQHTLRSLCDFKAMIDTLPVDDRGIFLKTYGEEFFSNKALSSEFVLSQKSDVDIVLDDGLLATLAGISDFEYGYEKDETLFNKCFSDIYLVYNSSGDTEDSAAFLIYKLIEIYDIIENINLEHLFYLYDHLEEMSLEGKPNEFAEALFEDVKEFCKTRK